MNPTPSRTGNGWPPARRPANGTTIILHSTANESIPSEPGSRYLRNEMEKEGVSLVPIRLLVAAAWLWSFTDRVTESGWRDGSAVTAFFARQLNANRVVFPEYRTLIADVVLPRASAFGWLVLVGQALVGIALLSGVFTNAALLGGIALNLAVLLAGSPEPAAFAILVQALLLVTNAGAVIGLDARLSRVVRTPFLVAQPSGIREQSWRGWIPRAVGTLVALAVAGYGGVYATDWSPTGILRDPAALLTILAAVVAGWSTIGWLRVATRRREAEVQHEVAPFVGPGWPDGWEPSLAASSDPAAIDHLGTADLEWSFRNPLPEWSGRSGR